MHAIAARILRDGGLASDALQSALIIAWRQLPSLRDPARFEAWVRRLLVMPATPRPGVAGLGRRMSASAGRRAGQAG